MKYIIPIEAVEELVNRGKDIASRIPTTPKEQFNQIQNEKERNDRKD